MAKNTRNLTPLTERTPEEARAIRSAGGRSSAEARRRKRDFRERAKMVLELRPKARRKLMKEWEELGYDVEQDGMPTVAERIAMSLAQRAEDGDDNALRLLMSYSHNPTMAEKLEGDKIRAMAEGKSRVDVSVTREESGIMDEIRGMMQGTAPPPPEAAAPPV